MNLFRRLLHDLSLRSSRPSHLFSTHTQPAQAPAAGNNSLSIPPEIWAEHAAIFAPSGHGKTQLLQTIICTFLDQADPPSMFIIDSQGEMLNKLERLECFNPDDGYHRDRIIIIDPEDPDPPALNLFHLGDQSAITDDLFQYIFTAIDNTLTPQQSTTVTYLMRLMHAIPNSTINTLREVLEDRSKNAKYAKYIQTLDPIAQDFFANQFNQTGGGGGAVMQVTRSSIARRLYALLANPVFSKIFGAEQNRFNALHAMQAGKIVLINTSQKILGQASPVFGRFFIAQALTAAYQRPQNNRPLALLIVDEASDYLDYQAERIFSTARKFGLGMISASQFLSQLEGKVKDAIYANTAIKMVGPVSYEDANKLGREMYTDGETIRKMKKTATHTQFMTYIRSLTPKPAQVTIELGKLEGLVTMTAEQHQALRTANRLKFGSGAPAPVKPTVHGHEELVSFPDYGIEASALLDSGASMTCIPADNLVINAGVASFGLCGVRIELPILRYATLSGFTNQATQHPVVSLLMTIGTHTGEEEVALSLPGTTVLIGRTFLSGRIIVSSDPAKGSDKKW